MKYPYKQRKKNTHVRENVDSFLDAIDSDTEFIEKHHQKAGQCVTEVFHACINHYNNDFMIFKQIR